jgi:hypothetical protein
MAAADIFFFQPVAADIFITLSAAFTLLSYAIAGDDITPRRRWLMFHAAADIFDATPMRFRYFRLSEPQFRWRRFSTATPPY